MSHAGFSRGSQTSRSALRFSIDVTIAMCRPCLISEKKQVLRIDPG
jgi:hypothetical protein